MFKEEEKGTTKINLNRTSEAVSTGASIIATACPFCISMFNDGLKQMNKDTENKVLDISELILQSIDI